MSDEQAVGPRAEGREGDPPGARPAGESARETGEVPGRPTSRHRRPSHARHRSRRRSLVLGTGTVVVTAGLIGTGLVLSEPAHPGVSRAALDAAISHFAVKPIALSSIAFDAASSTHVAAAATTASGSSGAGGAPAVTVSATSPLPPSSGATKAAPAGFVTQVDGLYQQMTTVNQKAATGASIPGTQPSVAPSSFDQMMKQLNSQELDLFYSATQQAPEWPKLSTIYGQIGSGTGTTASSPSARATANAAKGAVAAANAAVAQVAASGGSPYPYPNSSTTTTFTPATTGTLTSAATYGNCPVAPGSDYGLDAVYGAQLAIDAFTTVDSIIPQDLTLGAEAVGEGDVSTIPDPAWIVVQALLAVAEVTHDTLAWRVAITDDCLGTAQQAQITDINSNVDYLTALVDSRTTALENEAEAIYALVDSQTTLILNQLAVVQASINLQTEVVISQDLLQGSSGAVAELEEPASDGGYLDAVPIGVQELVTGALTAAEKAGELSNPAAPQDLASANAALAAGQYKQAFTLYSQTYREISQ